MGLAQRAIFVGLRDERVEPALDVALLDRLRQPWRTSSLRVRDRVDLMELARVGIAVGKRRGIFERRLGQRRARSRRPSGTARLEAVGRRRRDRLAQLPFGLVVPIDRHAGRTGRAGLGSDDCRFRAGGEGGAAQGEARGRADPFLLLIGRLNAAAPPKRSRPSSSVFQHVRVAQPLGERGAGAVGLAAGHRIGAIIGGVEGARPVVAATGRCRRTARSTGRRWSACSS